MVKYKYKAIGRLYENGRPVGRRYILELGNKKSSLESRGKRIVAKWNRGEKRLGEHTKFKARFIRVIKR